MRKLLKKLLPLWLILSIALLPLQSFGALSAPAASEPCMMDAAASHHQHAGGRWLGTGRAEPDQVLERADEARALLLDVHG